MKVALWSKNTDDSYIRVTLWSENSKNTDDSSIRVTFWSENSKNRDDSYIRVTLWSENQQDCYIRATGRKQKILPPRESNPCLAFWSGALSPELSHHTLCYSLANLFDLIS